MTAAVGDRRAAVVNLIAAARSIYDRRETCVADLATSTGLSRAGVELGFQSLEIDATEAQVQKLLDSVPLADRVHVILAANVFVAPLRAIVLARAAAPTVTVRPSRRDPWLARALVAEAKDPSISITPDLDVGEILSGEVHVYGHDETVAAVRARVRCGVLVRAHGAGMGVAFVSRAAECERAAHDLAADVVAFDQRGCLSPRAAFVEGGALRAREFAHALHRQLASWGKRVPRGLLSPDERRDATRWRDAVAFSSELLDAADHAVAFSAETATPWLPPAGRHVLVVAAPTLEHVTRWLAPIAAFVVAVGSDDPGRARGIFPDHARLDFLGRMQRPPLDGPVDRRASHSVRPQICPG
ncbi:MAG: acyl-CoA reductase [Polyangiaceae bacterium]